MVRALLYLLPFITLSLPLHTSCVDYQELGAFPVAFPAFSTLVRAEGRPLPSNHVYDLFLSSFTVTPGATDHVWGVHDVGRMINEPGQIQPTLISDVFAWPNEVTIVPEPVFAESGVVCVCSGRLPPKNDGSVALIPGWPGNVGDAVLISGAPQRQLWSYTRAPQWVDMNGDGRLDAVVARLSFVLNPPPAPPTIQGELVWFEQPVSSGLQTPNWASHVVIQGPEFGSLAVRLTITGGDEKQAFLCPEYFGRNFRVVWTEDSGDIWTDPTLIRTATIDDDSERYFDVQLTDVNGDGKDDLLVVTSSETNGTVRVYEIPEDFRTGTWERHVIASGFSVPGNMTMGKGTPGSAVILRRDSKKPTILLSGDDDRHAYLLVPSTDDPTDWSYDKRPLLTSTGIVGGISAADIDGDGNIEAFIPAYGEDKVHVFRFTDAANGSDVRMVNSGTVGLLSPVSVIVAWLVHYG
uniref:VCBS repeat-containing protein n=1 Tax=Branchiostoma floridae TaxID=7739 RepID=C3ZIT7_BRAFL|eukprot:XP_002591527.1 hypothetical protein BRAFLDRAFT_105199 [Branchiostoma floridae]